METYPLADDPSSEELAEREEITAAQREAHALADAFMLDTRNGCGHQDCDEHERPTFWRLRDESPQWMTDAVHATHGAMLPDDWKYEHCSRGADAIAEALDYNDGDIDAVDTCEIADGLVDVYTSARTAWLASSLERLGYVDEATAEFGPADDLIESLERGQYMELSEIANALVSAIRERAEEMDAEQ